MPSSDAGFLGFFLLAEQTHTGGNRLVGGGEASASHLGLDELLEVCGQLGIHADHIPFIVQLTTVADACRGDRPVAATLV